MVLDFAVWYFSQLIQIKNEQKIEFVMSAFRKYFIGDFSANFKIIFAIKIVKLF